MLKNNFINDVYTGQMGVQERYHDRSEGAAIACTTAPLTAAFRTTGFDLWIFSSKDWKAMAIATSVMARVLHMRLLLVCFVLQSS